jgi:leader peptidase (prepilin peptidase)/N-methyltransferase
LRFLLPALSGLVAWRFGFGWTVALVLVFTWTLIALTFIDADTTLLPDDLTLPLLWLGLLANLAGMIPGVSLRDASSARPSDTLHCGRSTGPSSGGKEGMGYGD